MAQLAACRVVGQRQNRWRHVRNFAPVRSADCGQSDRNDALGIARIMQCGWYKEIRVKSLDSHAVKALLVSRALLVKIKRDLENQIRGLLKKLGLVIGRAKMNVFAVRAAEMTEDRPELAGCGSAATQRSCCHRAADRGFGPQSDAAGPQ